MAILHCFGAVHFCSRRTDTVLVTIVDTRYMAFRLNRMCKWLSNSSSSLPEEDSLDWEPADHGLVPSLEKAKTVETKIAIIHNKVVTTMAIRLLDDRTHCAGSDLRSLIWGFGASCVIVHRVTSQPVNVFSNVPYWHFRQSRNGRLHLKGGFFNLSVRGAGDVGIGDRPIP